MGLMSACQAKRSRSRSRGRSTALATPPSRKPKEDSALLQVLEQLRSADQARPLSSPLTKTPKQCASPNKPSTSWGKRLKLANALEENLGIDSWNLRASPSQDAPVVGTLSAGQHLEVLGETEDGQWLRATAPPAGREGGNSKPNKPKEVFAAKFHSATVPTAQKVQAFVPVEQPEVLQAQDKGSPGVGSAEDRARKLIQELTQLRRRYLDKRPGAQGKGDDAGTGDELAYISRRIEDVMTRLEFLGIPTNEVLDREDPGMLLLLLRGRSFAHNDFSNPFAETCWLSCLFQSLWHSVVFHAAFELALAPTKFTPSPEEKILAALQRTWVEYQKAGELKEESLDDDDDDDVILCTVEQLVAPEDLANAFGEGYGDMSEALAALNTELSSSGNPAVAALANLVVYVPVPRLEGKYPTPELAWKQALEWQASTTPIIAVDLSLPAITQASCRSLATLWAPQPRGEPSPTTSCPLIPPDLGPSHHLVALVCYIWKLRHYVAFCRRQRDPDRCLFFNDLPGLTKGAPRELRWEEVPELCYRYSLTPRLVLYESLSAAEEVVHVLRPED